MQTSITDHKGTITPTYSTPPPLVSLEMEINMDQGGQDVEEDGKGPHHLPLNISSSNNLRILRANEGRKFIFLSTVLPSVIGPQARIKCKRNPSNISRASTPGTLKRLQIFAANAQQNKSSENDQNQCQKFCDSENVLDRGRRPNAQRVDERQ